MELTFIRRNPENRRLILIFTGWSTGPELYRDIDMPGWDLAVAHDFMEMELDVEFLENYSTVYLFAWSFGVHAARVLLPGSRITEAFAINGTLSPLSDSFGIPHDTFQKTCRNLTPRNLAKFRRRMMPDADTCRRLFPEEADEDEVNDLKRQLLMIFMDSLKYDGDIMSKIKEEDDVVVVENSSEIITEDPVKWRRAYVAADDRIFPPANMTAAWEREQGVEILPVEGSHFLDMGKIIASVIADTEKVSGRFAKASSTYDSYALAQQLIARRLALLTERNMPANVDRILEIGPGTGYFTGCYSAFAHPRRIDFVDISPVGPFGFCGEENYFEEDAELWISDCDERYDMIVSASAIQWFADIDSFFAQCARVLNPDGLLAVSTFAPGNLSELDAVRPAPLLYPSAEKLKKILERHFTDVKIEQAEIKLHFETSRQMLMHLKHTGVAGSATPGSGARSRALAEIRTLTYRPLFLSGFRF